MMGKKDIYWGVLKEEMSIVTVEGEAEPGAKKPKLSETDTVIRTPVGPVPPTPIQAPRLYVYYYYCLLLIIIIDYYYYSFCVCLFIFIIQLLI